MSESLIEQERRILLPVTPQPLASEAPYTRPAYAPSSRSAAQLLAHASSLADEIAARPNHGETELPRADLHRLAEFGALTAALPVAYGGLGFGTEPEGQAPLLRLLSIVGSGDLVLGRLLEGHVNAIILICSFGTTRQIEQAARDCRAGRWFAVWNTGPREPLQLEPDGDGHFYRGAKTFATGAAFVERPIVTAQLPDGSWQMTLPRMESPGVAPAIVIDRSFWNPLGMQSSESFGVDFTGARITAGDLIGQPGDYYRDPLFYGGSIRFAAVHAGAVLRLHRLFAQWVDSSERRTDPYQLARLGEVALSAQQAVLWVERAATVAAECLFAGVDKLSVERMHETADMTRLSIERLATDTLARIVAGVGARGLLQPSRFERIVRDLTMYLRQPIPDHTLAAVGRNSMRKSSLRAQGAGSGFWLAQEPENSLPAAYFDELYLRSPDPWNFETSSYESAKYAQTLASLPRLQYSNALEIGCSIGVLTEQLAQRADSLLAVDISERALDVARARCAALPHVRFARLQIPREEPTGSFDLIVLSEVGYYWQREDLDRAAALLGDLQPPGSHLLLVHHTDPVPDYPLTGDQVHAAFLARPEWKPLAQQLHPGYRLDLLERCL